MVSENKMELKNYQICPTCSQNENNTIDNLKPMKMIFFSYLNKYKMKCEVYGKVWDLPKGFENDSMDCNGRKMGSIFKSHM